MAESSVDKSASRGSALRARGDSADKSASRKSILRMRSGSLRSRSDDFRMRAGLPRSREDSARRRSFSLLPSPFSLLRSLSSLFLLLTAALQLSSCTVGPDYTRPETPEPIVFHHDFDDGESIADIPWWELFEDPVLLDLIDSALVNNRNVLTSLARITEAEAELGIVRADLWPRINYGAGAAADITTAEGDELNGDITAALSASYIVDLWGRVRRSNEAAVQALLATEESYRAVTLTLIASVARAYVLLRDLDNRLELSEQTVESRRASLDVIRARYEGGFISEVDVNQSEIVLGDAEVSVTTFERLRDQTENAISLLIGAPPMDIPRGLPLDGGIIPPQIPPGLPSELLQRRPDILIAERQLSAQTAVIGIAEALKFPQLNLTSDLGAIFSGDFTGFFDVGADLFGPLFNSGESQARVDVEMARTEQLVYQYEETILNALRETEDALVAVDTYDREYEARLRQLESAENAAQLSWVRYENGVTSYLEVLDLERSHFSAQLRASETLQLKMTSVVQLYQALGGGWNVERDSLGIPIGSMSR